MKKTISFVLALVMCLSLCACGGKETVVMIPSNEGVPQNDGSEQENNGQYTAYVYDGDPTDSLTVEEVVLMPERFPMAVMDVNISFNWKMKVRNTSGADIPMKESAMRVWYRYLDENEDSLYELYGTAGYSSTVKDGRAEWIEVSGIPAGWTDKDIESIAYLEIYAYTISLHGSPDYEFTNPVLIDVREVFDWENVTAPDFSDTIYYNIP